MTVKELDAGSWMRRDYGKRGFYEMFVFILSARESAEERGDMGGGEWTSAAIKRRTGGRLRYF